MGCVKSLNNQGEDSLLITAVYKNVKDYCRVDLTFVYLVISYLNLFIF